MSYSPGNYRHPCSLPVYLYLHHLAPLMGVCMSYSPGNYRQPFSLHLYVYLQHLASPLGVYDFLVRTSLIRYSAGAIRAQADLLEGLARLEGLEAHARAVTVRR